MAHGMRSQRVEIRVHSIWGKKTCESKSRETITAKPIIVDGKGGLQWRRLHHRRREDAGGGWCCFDNRVARRTMNLRGGTVITEWLYQDPCYRYRKNMIRKFVDSAMEDGFLLWEKIKQGQLQHSEGLLEYKNWMLQGIV